MKQQKRSIRLLSVPILLATAMNAKTLTAEPLDSALNSINPTEENIKNPNGIPEHQSSEINEPFLHPNINVRPDPSIQIGPGVINGPGVYLRGQPMPNPLLKDVLPANHPLLTHPPIQ